MKFKIELDLLSYKYLKAKNLLELSCDDSCDDFIGTVIYAFFMEFESERKNITDLLVRRRAETYIYTAEINITGHKLRNVKRESFHPDTIDRIRKFIRKQVLNEYLCHMRLARKKFNQHREDATYEFKDFYGFDDDDISTESLLRYWSRKRKYV